MLNMVKHNFVVTKCYVGDKPVNIVHRHGDSDIGIVKQTFEHRQYVPNEERFKDICDEYQKILDHGSIQLIVDAGANIGSSTAWFGENFPLSHIVSIEPSAENFTFLVVNGSKYWVDFRCRLSLGCHIIP
ncbi:MAG: hypothetical protein PHT60_01170 [Acidiphilium sp.]|nr:hypothetical protein [Acidiphilium sp.]MDD4934367.1 hypothetical protein [Acidiphilium sp.]